MVVQWTPLTDTGGVALTGYKVYHIDGSTSTTVLGYDGEDLPTTVQVTLAALTLDETYDIYVVGLNGDNHDAGPASDYLSITAAALPDEPGAITLVSRIDNHLELSWVASADTGGSAILGYVLYLVNDNDEDEVVYYGTATSTTVQDLTQGETYYFKASAINAVGESDFSSMYGFQIVLAPSAPLNMAVDSFDSSFVTTSWELPLDNGG